jgi:hypothetical protein
LNTAHTQSRARHTKAPHGVLAMMICPPYKPRGSAWSALLTVQYVTDDPGLAVHPREGYYTALRPLTGAANIRVGRTSTLKQRSRVAFDCE